MTRIVLPLLAVLLLFCVPAHAQPCTELKAIFFDLGDTLVEQDPDSGLFVLKPGAAETLAQLQAMGMALGVITNVPPDWDLTDLQAVLQDPTFLDDFDVIVLSSEAPAPKPDPAIYTHAHSLLSPTPAITEVAFVGETLGEIADAEPPTEGARAVGMVGIHVSSAPPDPLADYTIAPDDLPAVVAVAQSHGQRIFCDGFESGDTILW